MVEQYRLETKADKMKEEEIFFIININNLREYTIKIVNNSSQNWQITLHQNDLILQHKKNLKLKTRAFVN